MGEALLLAFDVLVNVWRTSALLLSVVSRVPSNDAVGAGSPSKAHELNNCEKAFAVFSRKSRDGCLRLLILDPRSKR